MTASPAELRAEIVRLAREYHATAFPPKPFMGGISAVPVSGKVFDGDFTKGFVFR